MDFIQQILGDRKQELIGAVLQQTDLGRDAAETFVPEAGTTVAKALAGSADDLDLSNVASASNVSMLLDRIDIGALASRAGVGEKEGSAGLAALLPLLLNFVAKEDSAVGALSALAKADGALDDLKDLGGKLFG